MRWFKQRLLREKGETIIADGIKWVKLTEAKRWHPMAGEAITGVFLGFQERNGNYGEYRLAILLTNQGKISISGSMLVSLIESSVVEPGDSLRVVYCGTAESNMGHLYKRFDVFVDADIQQSRTA